MKRSLLILCLVIGYTSLLLSETVWNNPLELFNSTEFGFRGKGLHTSDNCYLLTWEEGPDYSQGYLGKFDSQMQIQWQVPTTDTNSEIIETSDGGYVMFFGCGGIYASKISHDGVCLWQSVNVTTHHTYWSNWNIVGKPDNNGGAYFCWAEDQDYIRIHHITSNGSVLGGNNGIWYSEYGYNCYNPDIFVLPDNHIILSYFQFSRIYLKELDQNGVSQWTNQYPQTAQYVFPYLIKSVDNSFYLLMHAMGGNSDSLYVSRYTLDGIALWENPIKIAHNVDGEQKYLLASDNSLIALWRQYDLTLKCQKINEEGQLLWGTNGISIYNPLSYMDQYYYLSRDANGGCFVLWYTGESQTNAYQTYVQHVTSNGDLLPQPANIRSMHNDNRLYGLLMFQNENSTNIIHADIRGSLRGVYLHSVNAQGENIFGYNGFTIMQVNGGFIDSVKLCERTNGTLLVWEQSGSFGSFYSDIFYQFVNPDGTLALNPGGVPITTSTNNYGNLTVTNSPDNYTLITWCSGAMIKGQLLDPDLNQLWEPNGRIIVLPFNDPHFAASYENGSFYIVWLYSNTLYGQRFVNGEAQWTLPGVPICEGLSDFVSLNGRYLTWDLFENGILHGILYTLLFSENGYVENGFTSEGLQIATIPQPYYGQDYKQSLNFQDDLLVLYNDVNEYFDEWGDYHIYHVDKAQVIASDGTRLWGEEGYNYDNSKLYLVKDDHIFSAWISGSTLHLQKLNSDGSISWQTTTTATYLANTELLSFYAISGNRFLFIIDGFAIGVWHLYCYADDGIFYLPTTGFEITYPYNSPYDTNYYYVFSSNLPGTAAIWGNDTSLYLQLLSNTYVDVDDQTNPPVTRLVLYNAYPNPFNPSTTLCFGLPSAGIVKLDIYNIKGQKVKSLLNEQCLPGKSKVVWDGKDDNGKSVASGLYFAKISSGGQNASRKLVLVK
jgi:hypothetical protein